MERRFLTLKAPGWRPVALVSVLALVVACVAWRSASSSGGVELSLEVDGRTRTCVLHVPRTYAAAGPAVPLVIVLHGGGGNGDQVARSCGMNAVADRENFIVAYPNGTSRIGPLLTWNAEGCCGYANAQGVDDVAFIRALVGEIERRYDVDPRRIYATGMSNGGMMAYRLGCRLADRLAAIAPVAGALNERSCAPSVPMPVVIFHGTDDQHVLYEGGVGPSQLGGPRNDTPVREAVSFWVAHNRCSKTPVKTKSASGRIVKDVYGNGSGGAEVVLYTIKGGGHAWPGGVAPKRPGADAPTTELSASEAMWEFFKRHPKPEPAR